MNKISYIPFLHIHPELKQEMMDSFEQFYDDQNYILGSGLENFEKAYASYNGVKHAIGTGNGHDALLIILRSLKIGRGDEVIIPAHTFIATALSIVNAQAAPVLVDIDPNSFNIDPKLIEEKITEKTRAIVPVHLYGNPCAMNSIQQVAKKHNLHLIEDNAQAQGAEYKNQKTGSFGIMNFSSFYPTKNIGALGDGGIITTDSDELALRAMSLRNYGRSNDGFYSECGINSRLDELQAKFLSIKLKYLYQWNIERINLSDMYQDALKEIEEIQMQHISSNSKSARHIFPILCDKRDDLKKHLALKRIDTLIHYNKPIHLQKAFSFLNYENGSFQVAENICAKELSLPIYPGLKENEVAFICNEITKFFAKS